MHKQQGQVKIRKTKSERHDEAAMARATECLIEAISL